MCSCLVQSLNILIDRVVFDFIPFPDADPNDTNVKYRSCEVDVTGNWIEIIRCAKGGESFALVGHCWAL